MILSAEAKDCGRHRNLFFEESWPMKASRLRVPCARINHFFSGTDMAHPHQRMFISALVGGREKHTARDITAVHARLRARVLNDIHFDAFLKHFRAR